MKNTTLALATALLFSTTQGFAHGPVRQKVVETVDIAAPAEKVWAAIKDFGKVHDWLPVVKSTEVKNAPSGDGKCQENDKNEFVWVNDGADSGNTPCATRVLTLIDGGKITEMLKGYSAKKMKYSYRITDMSTAKTIKHAGEDVPIKALPVTNYSAGISVKEGKNGCSVKWKSGFYRGYMNNNPPADLTEEVAVNAVMTVFKSGLAKLKKNVEGK